MKSVAALITCLIYYCQAAQSIEQTPPNIVLILADDLGYDDLSYRGNNEFLTPNIDALAYHGKILKNFYAAPMCTPTRSSLLSGKFTIRTGLQHYVISNDEDTALPLSIKTLPDVLREAGYATHLVGKWHLGMARKEYTPTYRGFDHHFGYWGSFLDFYRRTLQLEDGSYGYDFRRDLELSCEHPNRYLTDLFSDEAERIIYENNGTKPLFLMVSHAAPHDANPDEPLQAPAEIIKKYSYIKDPKHRIYAAMVHKLDESIGRIVRALDKSGKLNNSIIIFNSDNGAPSIGKHANTGSNWPMKGQKNTPWEAASRVGSVIWSPLLENRGTIFEQPMHIVDWYPTLAKAAGATLSADLALDGIDFWSQLKAKNSTSIERDMVHFLDDIDNVVSYAQGNWKYIKGTKNQNYDQVLTFRELYDISPKNYTREVLNSPAALSLQKFDKQRLSVKRINSLRSVAGVKCSNTVQRACNTLLEECLYNIAADPCEENNLANLSESQTLLEQLRQRVAVYRENSIGPLVSGNTTFNSPRYHDCKWTTFAQETPKQLRTDCNVNSYTLYCPVHY